MLPRPGGGGGGNQIVTFDNGAIISGGKRYTYTNSIIAGTKNQGRDALMQHLIGNALNAQDAVFVIQNGSALSNNTLRNSFFHGWGGRQFFSLDLAQKSATTPINFLKNSSIDFVHELIVLLFKSFKGNASDDLCGFVERYFNEILQLYKRAPQKKLTLANLGDFDYHWMETEAYRLEAAGLMSTQERDRVLRYTSNLPMYQKELLDYENFCIELSKFSFAQLLSGSVSYNQLNSNQYITFITLDPVSKPKQSKAFLHMFIHKALSMIGKSGIHTTFVFEDINLFEIDEFPELLRSCNSSGGDKCIFTLDSVVSRPNDTVDFRTLCNCYFVMRQSTANEAEEWSKTIGSHKVLKETMSTAPYTQIYGRENRGLLGGIVNFLNRNREVYSGKQTQEVEEYVVLPEEFIKLSGTECMVIVNSHGGYPYYQRVVIC